MCMKKLQLIILFAGILLSLQAFSQETGKVEVIKDPKIDSLIARRLELSRSANGGSALTAKGFRLQIYSGNDRKEAYAEQTKFKVRFPAVGTYISYEQPNYKIRVGDFRTRIEAEKFLNKLRPYYQSVFIFSERIYLK
jgi:hypothetical protein